MALFIMLSKLVASPDICYVVPMLHNAWPTLNTGLFIVARKDLGLIPKQFR